MYFLYTLVLVFPEQIAIIATPNLSTIKRWAVGPLFVFTVGKMGQAPQFRALFEPAITAMGYELVGVEYLRQGTQGLLRVYIDSEEGITADDCGDVSHQVSGILEVEDPIREHYVLEVSSPGLDRPLYTAEDFVRFTGNKAKIRTRMHFEGRRNYTGVLHGVEEDQVLIEVDNEEFRLPLDEIDKANLVPDI